MTIHLPFQVKQGAVAAVVYFVAASAGFITAWAMFARNFALVHANGNKETAATIWLYIGGCIVAGVTLLVILLMISAIRSCRWSTSRLRNQWGFPFSNRTICIYYHPSDEVPESSSQADRTSPCTAGLIACGSCVIATIWFVCAETADTIIWCISYQDMRFIFGTLAFAMLGSVLLFFDKKNLSESSVMSCTEHD